jgi:hypothetical protein
VRDNASDLSFFAPQFRQNRFLMPARTCRQKSAQLVYVVLNLDIYEYTRLVFIFFNVDYFNDFFHNVTTRHEPIKFRRQHISDCRDTAARQWLLTPGGPPFSISVSCRYCASFLRTLFEGIGSRNKSQLPCSVSSKGEESRA